MTESFFFFTKKSWMPLHVAAANDSADTCQLLCALDGVDQSAVDNYGQTALDFAISCSIHLVRALLELNFDTSNVVVDADANVEIVQLFDDHCKRSVKLLFFRLNNCFWYCFFLQEIERIAICNRVLEEQRAKIQKYFKFEVVIFCYIQRRSVTFFNLLVWMARNSWHDCRFHNRNRSHDAQQLRIDVDFKSRSIDSALDDWRCSWRYSEIASHW